MLLVSDRVSGWSRLYLHRHVSQFHEPSGLEPLLGLSPIHILPLDGVVVVPVLLLLSPLHILQLELGRGIVIASLRPLTQLAHYSLTVVSRSKAANLSS
jgi:hypothetical protein